MSAPRSRCAQCRRPPPAAKVMIVHEDAPLFDDEREVLAAYDIDGPLLRVYRDAKAAYGTLTSERRGPTTDDVLQRAGLGMDAWLRIAKAVTAMARIERASLSA